MAVWRTSLRTLAGMPKFPLTEGDLVRGLPPDLDNPHWYCGIVDPSTGAVCTKRPHDEDQEHLGFETVHGGGQDRRLVGWRGGAERAMVVAQGYTWTRVPGTDLEVRALANRPVALRYWRRTAISTSMQLPAPQVPQ